ncbi:hypothetical protein ABH944_002375, partial [Caballeronia udeis]|uniref:reverse transcriptase domain-containing protein n=1 Tax=Caballeronia udeis TaxID=1232866 RepID=UPI0038374364
TLDPVFHPDSYGYRPGKSAKQAIAVTRKRCWQYDWVVEFDIKAAFDQIDHALLMRAIYVSGLHVRAQGSAQSTQPAIYRFPAGGEWRRAQTDEAGGAGLAGPSPHASDA